MILKVRNLQKTFDTLKVLKQMDLTLESGTIYCLMGPSGSGKTTLLRILMKLERADGGSIAWEDKPHPGPVRLSAVFQEDRLCEDFTPLENVLMACDPSLSKAQVRSHLSHLLPEESLSRPVSTLSGGMKRRTAICRALLAPSDAILMDEPFTGLDENTKKAVISYIKEMTAGKLVLISTHQEEDVALLGARVVRIG